MIIIKDNEKKKMIFTDGNILKLINEGKIIYEKDNIINNKLKYNLKNNNKFNEISLERKLVSKNVYISKQIEFYYNKSTIFKIVLKNGKFDNNLKKIDEFLKNLEKQLGNIICDDNIIFEGNKNIDKLYILKILKKKSIIFLICHLK